MALLIILCILIILSTFISLKFKKQIGYTFIISIFFIILSLYFFGYLKLLKLGVIFIEIISIFLLIYLVKNYKKEKENIKKYVLNWELLFFVIVFLALVFVHHGRMVANWDEFSHWGDVVKAMFTINDFSTSAKSMSMFQSYPPSISLFQYFFVSVEGSFVEYYLYVAYHLFAISLFFPLITMFKKVSMKLISLILFCVIPTLFVCNFYSTIYVDSVIGLTFGYAIILIIKETKFDFFFKTNILLTLFVLTLLKDVGLMFSIMVFFALIIKFFQNRKTNISNISNKKNLMFIFLALIVIILAKYSWSLNIALNNASIIFGNKIELKDFINLLTLNTENYRLVTIKNFLAGLNSIPLYDSFIKLDFIKLNFLFLALCALVYKKEYKNQFILLFVGFYIYIIGILVMYCFNFTEYEAIRLASFSRYINIYSVALVFILSFLLMNENKIKEKHKVVFFFILLIFVPFKNIIMAKSEVKNTIEFRKPYEISKEYIVKNIDSNDKIYFISQNTTGLDYYVMRYTMRPHINNFDVWNIMRPRINDFDGWSIGEKYDEGDIWTLYINADDWMDRLIKNKYDYVYLFKVDDEFNLKFGYLFDKEVKGGLLYKVNENTKKLESLE